MDDSVNKANQSIASSSQSSLESANLSNSQQNQQQHLKKLYFKQSTTEALHSAILLKARSPLNTCASNLVKTPSFSNYPSIKSDASNSSRQQLLKQISIQENSNVDSARIKLSDEEDSTNVGNILSIDSDSYSTTLLNNTANNYSDELDSPLKIKENIFMSINYLKPVFSGLDPLRSSTSDDEDSHSDNLDRKAKQIEDTSVTDKTQTQTSESSEVIILGSNNVKFNIFNKQTSLVQTASLQHLSQQYQQRSVYYRKNMHVINPNPKILSASSIKIQSTNATQATLVTTTEPTLIINKNNNLSVLNNKAGSKRGKEEALSNSSSSDEDDLNQKQSNFTNNSVNKLNQLFNQNGTVALTPIAKQMTTTSSGNKYNNMLTLNMSSGTQPHITPVVSAAANTNQTSGTNAIQSVTSSLEPEIINSPSSMSSTSSSFCSSSSSSSSSPSSNQSSLSKSQKSSIDQDYDSKFTNSLFSAASPNSCCSSTTTNEGGIDLTDDNSSTASGPIYVRQPGFEHHAHEIVIHQTQQPSLLSAANTSQHTKKLHKVDNETLNTLKNFVINDNKSNRCSLTGKPKKSTTIETNSQLNSLKQTNSTYSLNNLSNIKSNKAKKKLCTIGNDIEEETTIETKLSSNTTTNYLLTDFKNCEFKTILSKSKREPLPMRMRALPASFWQQPNQPNVSPGTMYLPPLFRNEIDNVSDATLDDTKFDNISSSHHHSQSNLNIYHQREVKISPANTDLLFKLFENVEQQKDKKQIQIISQSKYKLNRNTQTKQGKTLSKALIKGEDPCIIDAVSEGLFPQLKLDSRYETVNYPMNTLSSNGLSNSSPILVTSNSNQVALNTNNINANGFSFTSNSSNTNNNLNNNLLPLLQFEQNYSLALSEVVATL